MKYNAFLSYSHGQDSVLGPSIEKGLEKFAKPTFKRRALEIFRDGNDLSIAADLGDKIRMGLENSEFFICMANQRYAQSKWCQREVDYWLENKPIENFLIILTEGEILWDEDTNDFDWNVTTALPRNLSGVFKGEPFYVDFRNLGTEENLNLDNPEFEKRLVVLAATLHGKSIGDMIGEATKQYKRTIRIRNWAVAIVMSLMTLAIVLTMINLSRTKASLLHFRAKAMESTNPTLALRLEQEALKIYDYPEFERSAFSIINRNSFYRILASKDTSIFTSVDISKNHIILLTSDDGSIILSHLEGNKIKEFNPDKGSIWSAKFSPDGNSILTGSTKGMFLWDLNGSLIKQFKYEGAESGELGFSAVSFSPDGNLVLAGSHLGAFIWNINGDRRQEFEIIGDIKSVAFSPDGTSVLIGYNGSKSAAGLFDLNGDLKSTFSTNDPNFGEPYTITNTVAFSNDGQTVMVCSSVNNIQLFDTNGNLKSDFKMPELINFENGSWNSTFSPDGTKILYGSFENTARLIDLKGEIIKEFKGHEDMVNLFAFDPTEDNMIFTGSLDKSFRKWYQGGLNALKVNEFSVGERPIHSIDVSPNNESILISSKDSSAFLWSFKGELLTEFKNDKSIVENAVFNPDGNSILTQTARGVSIWDLEGNLLQEYLPKGEIVDSFVLAPDGESILISTKSEIKPEGYLPWKITSIYKWKWEENSILEIPLNDAETDILRFSPNGKTFLTNSNFGTNLWDLEGSLIQEYKLPNEKVIPVAIAPNSSTIMTFPTSQETSLFGPSYGKTHLWNLEGRLIQEFNLNSESVDPIKFAQDNKSILTLSFPKINPFDKGSPTARIWDIEGTELLKIHQPDKYISSINLSPDGNYIIVGYMNSWNQFLAEDKDCKLVIYSKIELDKFLEDYVAPLTKGQKKEFDI
ncbi:toll/interleukin-1 receptor domain-containing protein [Algoriphagus sp.]|uniref:toll/interleukin-1 receptor domain-containing protein n=1 Tax=Algoriphagus sp. TaxID=1872435 RepID=UPI0025E0E005|nr:toll/interleukin-1 receptor domain-containing protein [Algoriphagus sp.]